MIGIDQEPTREILDELDRILGPGKYAIAYAEDAVGIRAYVRTRERPAREWAAYFAPGLAAESVLAVWRELTLRIERIVKGDSKPEEPPPVEPEPEVPEIDNTLPVPEEPPPEEKPPPGSEGPPLGETDPPVVDNSLPPGVDNELPAERPPIGATLPTDPEIDNELPEEGTDEPPPARTAEDLDDDDDALEADHVSER